MAAWTSMGMLWTCHFRRFVRIEAFRPQEDLVTPFVGKLHHLISRWTGIAGAHASDLAAVKGGARDRLEENAPRSLGGVAMWHWIWGGRLPR